MENKEVKQVLPKVEVFICASKQDSDIAKEICEALESAGISYFNQTDIEENDIDYYDYLYRAISSSQVFLLLASEHSYKSKLVKSEITFAFNHHSRGNIIPYIIDGSEMPSGFQFIFSSVNWRDRRTMPIVPGLVENLCIVLGRTVSTIIDNIDFEKTSYCSLGTGHKSGVVSLSIDKKSETIISGSKDGTVSLWDVFMGELKSVPIKVFEDTEVQEVFLLAGSDKFAACDGRTVRLWDMSHNECYAELRASLCAINPAGNFLAVSEGHNVMIYDYNSLELLFVAEIPSIIELAIPTAMCFSPDGKYLAVGNGVGHVVILNTETRKLEEFDDLDYPGDTTPYLRIGKSNHIFAMCYSPNGKTIFIASEQGISFCTEMSPKLHTICTDDVVESVSSSPDGRYFAIADYAGAMVVYRTEDGTICYKKIQTDVNRVLFAPNGEFIATGDIYGAVSIWPLYNK